MANSQTAMPSLASGPSPAPGRWSTSPWLCQIVALIAVMVIPGCHIIKGKSERSRYQPIGVDLAAAQSAEGYMAVRQARAQNGVVLQIVGDVEPNRILPLPSSGKRVFVSNLLEQTGVISRLENMDVVLYRASPNSIEGIEMEVRMDGDGASVRPECDYALHAGDRIRVTRIEKDAFQSIVDMTLGR